MAMFVTLVAVLLYGISNSLFYHSHCIDGEWIAHSHITIFDGGEAESHNHTDAEITAIKFFALSLFGGFALVAFVVLLLTLQRGVNIYVERVVESTLLNASGRAPPFATTL